MTVATTARSQSFAGGQSVLTFNFRTLTADPQYILVNAVSGSTTTPLVYNVGYTVSVNASGVGGTVTVSPTYSTAYTYVVYRSTTITQTSAYSDYNQFPASTLENNLDQLTMIAQEQSNSGGLTFTFPVGTSTSYSTLVPTPVANQLLTWDPTGTFLINSAGTAGPSGATGAIGPSGSSTIVSSSTTDVTVVTTSTTATITAINAGTTGSKLVRLTAAGLLPVYYPYVKVSETQTSGTDGGTATSGSWITRVLNTTDSDTGSISSLGSNQVTLPAGTYLMNAYAPFYDTGATQIRLYDITHSTSLLIGQNNVVQNSSGVLIFVSGVFTLSASSALAIQYQVASTSNTNGLGVKTSWGTEVYTIAEFTKIA